MKSLLTITAAAILALAAGGVAQAGGRPGPHSEPHFQGHDRFDRHDGRDFDRHEYRPYWEPYRYCPPSYDYCEPTYNYCPPSYDYSWCPPSDCNVYQDYRGYGYGRRGR